MDCVKLTWNLWAKRSAGEIALAHIGNYFGAVSGYFNRYENRTHPKPSPHGNTVK